jgi:hypothetical protein
MEIAMHIAPKKPPLRAHQLLRIRTLGAGNVSPIATANTSIHSVPPR